MSIRERTGRPNFPYEVRWREEGRHRSRGFRTEKEAVRFEGKVADRLALGAHAPEEPSRAPLEDWIDRWVDSYGPAWAERTLIQRTQVLDSHVVPMIGGVRLLDLGRKRLVTYRTDLLTRGRSPKTVNAVLRVLSACLKDAEREGLIPANPLRGLSPLPEPPVERRAIPMDIAAALVDAMTTDRDRLIVALICYAGLRPSEVRALRWRDIHDGAVSVTRAAGLTQIKRTKSGTVRAVPITPELRAVLERIPRGKPDALVAPADRGGLLDWHNWTARQWRDARDAVGVDFVPYEGRHTYASVLIAEGESPLQVAQWMGHAKSTMTLDTYGHLFTLRESSRGRGATDAPTVGGDAPAGRTVGLAARARRQAPAKPTRL